jgi:hypothetical protein
LPQLLPIADLVYAILKVSLESIGVNAVVLAAGGLLGWFVKLWYDQRKDQREERRDQREAEKHEWERERSAHEDARASRDAMRDHIVTLQEQLTAERQENARRLTAATTTNPLGAATTNSEGREIVAHELFKIIVWSASMQWSFALDGANDHERRGQERLAKAWEELAETHGVSVEIAREWGKTIEAGEGKDLEQVVLVDLLWVMELELEHQAMMNATLEQLRLGTFGGFAMVRAGQWNDRASIVREFIRFHKLTVNEDEMVKKAESLWERLSDATLDLLRKKAGPPA